MIKLRHILGFGALMFFGACEAPSIIGGDTASQRVSEARERNDAPAIWRVSDKDSELFLFGTLHLLPEDKAWFHQDIRNVFDRSATIFFEVPSGEKADLEAASLTQKLGFYYGGARLSDGFDNYQMRLLEARAVASDTPLHVLQSLRPWLAAEMLALAAAEEAGLSGELSADKALKSRAIRLKKHVVYLETVESQIKASASLADDVQHAVLMDALEDYNDMSDQVLATANSWSVGHMQQIKKNVVEKLKARSPEYYKAIFTDRNTKWAEQFITFLEGTETGFAAVGVAHMIGEDGINKLLRDAGYKVERYYGFIGKPVIETIDLYEPEITEQ